MKTLIQINYWAFGITLALYLTVYLGMLAQALLGIIQVVSALIVTAGFYSKLDQRLRNKIKMYWFAATFSLFLLWFVNSYVGTSNDFYELSVMIFLPMLTAIYFICLLNDISHYHENA